MKNALKNPRDDKDHFGFQVDPELRELLDTYNINLTSELMRKFIKDGIRRSMTKTPEVQSEDPIPDFRFTTVITDFRKLYNYVKSLSGHEKREDIVKALYDEYDPRTKEILKRMGNPLNADLYFDYVRDALKDVIQITGLEEKISGLNSEISRLESEKTKLSQEIGKINADRKGYEKKLLEIVDGMPEKEKERDTLEKTIANLRGDPGYKKLIAIMDSIQKFFDSINDERGKLDNERHLNRDKFLMLQEFRKEIPDFLSYLESDDFFTQSRLDDERKKLMDEMKKIAESNQFYVDNDLGRNNEKIGMIISGILEKFGENPRTGIPVQERNWIESNMADAMSLLSLNESRSSAIKRRKEK